MYKKMTNQQLIESFNEIFKTSGISASNINRYIKNHYSALYDEIEKRTIKLNSYKRTRLNGKLQDISIFERIYCLRHDLDDRPMCKNCNKKHVAGFMPYNDAYSDYCSQYCQKHSSICSEKRNKTRIEKYGVGCKSIYKKSKETRLKRYKSFHPKSFVLKTKATKLERYGNENYVNVEKQKQTIEKHKIENPNYYFDREQKAKQTKIKNGHDPNWNNRKKFKNTISKFSDERKQQIKDKRKNTCLENFNCEFATQSNEVQIKRQMTCMKLYNAPSTLNLKHVRDASAKKTREDAWDNFIACNYEVYPLFSKEDFIENNTGQKLWRWKCKKCGHKFEHRWKGFSRKCEKCHPMTYHDEQKQIEDFLRRICPYDNIQLDCRNILENGYELDIVDYTRKIAIEFNGLIWHNVDFNMFDNYRIDRMYHYDKTNECNNKGYQLIHIFEDSWLENDKLCKSKLKKIFKHSSIRHIDAKKCNIIEDIDNRICNKFLDKYAFMHKKYDIAFCLTYRNHIVAMMTFAKKYSQKYAWEIVDYIELNSFVVDYGFSTLAKHFVDIVGANANICQHISRDWYFRDSIDSCMRIIRTSQPSMFWTNRQQRFNVDEITTLNAAEFLNDFDKSKSFLQNMNDNKFYRIYDSGSFLCEYCSIK